jgi:hypothetical protein
MIGSPGYDRAVGAVFLYSRDSTGKWTPQMHLLPFDGNPRTLFGVGLAEVGSELWVGAPGAKDFQGRVYRFSRDSSGWTAASKTGVPGLEQQGQSLFGFSVATDGGVTVVGIPGQDFQEGGAALFTRTGTGWRLATQLAGDEVSLAAITGAKRECT